MPLKSKNDKKHPLIDTHAHLSFEQYEANREEVKTCAWNAGVEFIILVGAGAGLDGNFRALKLAKTDARFFATVGIHPHDAGQLAPLWIDELKGLLADEKVVALGEVGLDYFHKFSDQGVQRNVFEKLIPLADEFGKPIVIHDRDAHEDVWKILNDVGLPERRGVVHCFSGDVRFAEKVIGAGFYISISGVVTFKKARDLHEVVANMPLERMVIETDCPYLAPEPFRGKINEPSYVRYVAERIAEIKGLSLEDVARVTTLNAKRLFGLPGAELIPDIAYRIRNSLYLNITNSCNLACRFCPKFIDFEVKGYYLKLDKEPGVEDIFMAMGEPENYDEIVFCGYGEPTRRLEVLKVIAARMKEKGVKKVRLNTDGLANLLYGRNVLPELSGIIDSVSVSLNAADADFYSKICPSKFGALAYEEVCRFIVEAKKHIPEVTASVVALPGLDLDACRKKAKELGIVLKIREYMNVG